MNKQTATEKIEHAMVQLDIEDAEDSPERRLVQELVELMPEDVDNIPHQEFAYQLLSTILKMKKIALAMNIGQNDDWDSISELIHIEVKDWTKDLLSCS